MKKNNKKSSRQSKNKRNGMAFENKVQKTLSSGALWFDKGDLKTDEYCLECKFTEKSGYRITEKLLLKLWEEALEAGKLPGLIIGITGEKCEWIITSKIERKKKG